jgi:hypothetical protein
VTSKASTGEVEELKTAGSVGMNTAVSWCPPTANVDVVVDATPLLTITGLPRLMAPSLNWTVPAAVAGVTAAISVTGVPRETGDAGFVVSVVLVAVAPPVAPVTTKVTGDDVEVLKAAGLVGMNVAVSECDPAAKVDVDPDAVPLLTVTGLPRLLVPFLNWTVPAAVAGVIVAVSVTGVPRVTGEAGDVVSVVVVTVAPVITMVTAGDVDALNEFGSVGVNTAVNWCVPLINVDVVPDAVPLLTVTGLPRLLAPSLNWTVPAAVAGVTVAVSVTGVP